MEAGKFAGVAITALLLNGLEATRQILRIAPDAKILVLTSYGDEDCVAQCCEFLIACLNRPPCRVGLAIQFLDSPGGCVVLGG